jgi:heme a synthase
LAIKRLAFFSIVVTYLLIVFGGYVASSDSGMGCGPEWPLCNGLVIPILEGTTLIEFTHRVIGAFLGIMTVLLFFMTIKSKPDTKTRSTAWIMLVLLIIQVLLGAVVVVLDLPAIIVTIHLLIAMFFMVSLIWIWRKTQFEANQHHTYTPLSGHLQKSVNLHLNNVLVLLILTLAFGGYIKHESYGLACGWLGCGETIIPASIPEFLQTIHRVLAVISAVYIFLLTYWSFAKKWGASLQRRLALATLTVLVQLLIGVITIATNLDIPWAVLHLAVGTAMFAFVSEARIYLGSTMVKTSFKANKKARLQS